MTCGTRSSVARSVVAPEARPEIQATATPAWCSRTRPMPSRMEKFLVSLPSLAIATVPSVSTPSTSIANSRMAAQRAAEIFDFRFLILDLGTASEGQLAG